MFASVAADKSWCPTGFTDTTFNYARVKNQTPYSVKDITD